MIPVLPGGPLVQQGSSKQVCSSAADTLSKEDDDITHAKAHDKTDVELHRRYTRRKGGGSGRE